MRRATMISTLIFLLASTFFDRARAQVEMAVSIGEEGLRSFYLAIGDYYRVPEKEIIIVRGRGVPEEELPVVFYIARRARVSPATIIKLRLGGKSWMDITFRFGLSAEVFYVKVGKVKGPPYGKAYGYFGKTPRKKWKKIILADDDVINLVNLRFMSEHYGYSPDEVIKMRNKGKSFVGIHDHIRKLSKGKKVEIKGKKEQRKQKGKGKKDK